MPHIAAGPSEGPRIDLASALGSGSASGSGFPPLRSFIRQLVHTLNPDVPYRDGPEVVLTCGAADGLASVLDLLVDTWLESRDGPTARPWLLAGKFVGGNVVGMARARGIGVTSVEMDAQGLLATGRGGLANVLETWDSRRGLRPAILYTVT